MRTRALLMIDWIKRGIFGRDLSKVSCHGVLRVQVVDAAVLNGARYIDSCLGCQVGECRREKQEVTNGCKHTREPRLDAVSVTIALLFASVYKHHLDHKSCLVLAIPQDLYDLLHMDRLARFIAPDGRITWSRQIQISP